MNKDDAPLWWYAVGFLVLCAIGTCSMAIRSGESDALGCETVQKMNGWTSCRVTDHMIWMVSARGCSGSDGHAYEVEGTNASGQPATALVCCGTLLKSCTVRGR